jgi:hypothetical protein
LKKKNNKVGFDGRVLEIYVGLGLWRVGAWQMACGRAMEPVAGIRVKNSLVFFLFVCFLFFFPPFPFHVVGGACGS